MDIINYVVARRNESLLIGDYGTYRRHLSKRILKLRKKLGRTSAKGKKYVAKDPVMAEEVAKNPEYALQTSSGAERLIVLKIWSSPLADIGACVGSCDAHEVATFCGLFQARDPRLDEDAYCFET